ncbi:MAG TPA: crosslink repair DNA glycosylase YcaQ family protein [Chloroflexia bacterium]|nr:crosslink repair DNA glycosylase YcaQ family protein [Chloroflexia bacterium]
MSETPVSTRQVRRLAVQNQRLAGPRPTPDTEGLLEIVRDIGCLQLDPTSAVARSNVLVPFSRIGPYDTALLDQLLWEQRALFEYWAHAASIVLTEDYPIHYARMRRLRTGKTGWAVEIHSWIEANKELHDHVIDLMRERGPVASKDIESKATVSWWSSGWTNDRNVTRMLDFLWAQGIIMVAGRQGQTRLWDLAERVLPEWTPRDELPEREAVRQAVERSLRQLGVARKREIDYNYTRSRYWDLDSVLKDLEAEGVIRRVTMEDARLQKAGPWYVHRDDVPMLEQVNDGQWQPRTTLLSPFDNLIADRSRIELLFDYEYRIEIYVPRDKRKYGYYVLPILHGDRLIGRIDPLMDRKSKRLNVNAVYAEPAAPLDADTGRAVGAAIGELARFLGAQEIAYGETAPSEWRAHFPT